MVDGRGFTYPQISGVREKAQLIKGQGNKRHGKSRSYHIIIKITHYHLPVDSVKFEIWHSGERF